MKKYSSLVINLVLICLCFFLTSTGWLSWEYHLLDQLPSGTTDIVTMVAGYLLQAVGIGLFSFVIFRRGRLSARMVMAAALVIHLLCHCLALASPVASVTVILGLGMNLACGVIAGYYLYSLAAAVPENRKAIVFGAGYGLSTFASWLLSKIGGGSLYYSRGVLLICAALTVIILFTVLRNAADKNEEAAEDNKKTGNPDGNGLIKQKPAGPADNRLILTAFLMILIFGIVNSCGFAFSSADIGDSVNVELVRVIYAAGLVIAGILTDKNRKYGAICAVATLVLPFLVFSLKGGVAAGTLWLINYFIFGFYAVYRVIVFSDMASSRGLYCLAGFGLAAGRAGEAAGEAFCLGFQEHPVALTGIAAALFVIAIILFFKIYQQLYVPKAAVTDERERFYRFALAHDLSAREQDILKLIMESKTNGEIAAEFSISENTVKFHVRNLLQKTGCKNRTELLAAWHQYTPS